jgi:hypothetical protein
LVRIWAAAIGILAISTASIAKSETHAAMPTFSVPFELDHGHIFIEVTVNGRGPYRFGFDTGASGIGRADASITSELRLPSVGTAETSDGIRTASADEVAVRDLRVGMLDRHDVTLLSRDYNGGRKAGMKPIQGIIARDFFADVLVTINYPARMITFSEGSLADSPGAIPYGASLSIPVCFSKNCYPAKIDTGSSRSIVIPKDLAAKIAATTPTAIGQGARTNGVSQLFEMQLLEPVRVGKVTATGQKVLFTVPSDDSINVGSDFLKDYVLTIDQRHHLLRIARP